MNLFNAYWYNIWGRDYSMYWRYRDDKVWSPPMRNPLKERDGHIQRGVQLRHINRVSGNQSKGQLAMLGRIGEIVIDNSIRASIINQTLSWIL